MKKIFKLTLILAALVCLIAAFTTTASAGSLELPEIPDKCCASYHYIPCEFYGTNHMKIYSASKGATEWIGPENTSVTTDKFEDTPVIGVAYHKNTAGKFVACTNTAHPSYDASGICEVFKCGSTRGSGSIELPEVLCHQGDSFHVYVYEDNKGDLYYIQGSMANPKFWNSTGYPVEGSDVSFADSEISTGLYHKNEASLYVPCPNTEAHEYDSNSKCGWCKKTCTHPSYNFDYACIDCNYKCTHSDGFNKTNHRCVECGFECTHTNYNNGVCTICGSTCQEINTDHAWNNHNGVCDFCGITCLEARNAEGHVWNDGICTYCEYTCEHTSEARTTCPVCGKTLSPFTQEMLDVIAKVDKVSKWYKYKESDGKYYDMMSFWKIKWGRDYTGIQSFLESYFYNITGAKLEYKVDNDLYTFTVTDGTMEYAKVEALITETGYLAYFRVTTVDSTARIYMPNYTVYTLSELVELFNYQTVTYWEDSVKGDVLAINEAPEGTFNFVITTKLGYKRTIAALEQNVTLDKKTLTYAITAYDEFSKISAPLTFTVDKDGKITAIQMAVFGDEATRTFIQHTHSAAGYDTNYAPDCTNAGAYVYACSCGKYFSDSSCTTEIENLTEWLATNGEREEALGHDWSNADGVCARCEVTCEELNACHHYSYGVCDDCNYNCEHDEFNYGSCRECGMDCEDINGDHDWSNADGECGYCGMTCDHYGYWSYWDGSLEIFPGACQYCGYQCTHPNYRKDIQHCNCVDCGANISSLRITDLEEALSALSTTTGLTEAQVQTIVTAALANYAKATDITGINSSINALIMTVNNHADALDDLTVAMNILLNKTYLTAKDKTALETALAAEIAKVNETITTAVAALETKDASFEATISTLSTALTTATNATTANAAAIEALAARVSALETAVSSINADYLTTSDKAALEVKIAADIAKAISPLATAADLNAALSTVNVGLSELTETVAKVLQTITLMEGRIEALEAAGIDEAAVNALITTALAGYVSNEDYTSAMATLNKAVADIDALVASVNALNTAMNALPTTYMTPEQVNALVANAIAAYDANNGTAAMSEKMISSIDKIAEQIGKIGELFDRVMNLESAGFITETQAQEIMAPVANGYSSEYDLLSDRNYQTLAATVQYLQEVISELDPTNLEGRVSAVESENAAMKQDLAEVEAENAALAEAIEAMRAELEAMKNAPAPVEETDATGLKTKEAVVIAAIVIIIVITIGVVVIKVEKN